MYPEIITTLGCGNESVSCICKNTTESYANCACALGYEGNPYLLDGCTDIDECEFMDDDESGNYCQGSECVNIVGSYYCKHKVSIRDINTVGILLIVGSCLLVLVGVGALYILIRRGMRIKRQKKFFKRNGGLLLQQQLTTTQGNVETTRVFSSKELSKATGNFRESRVPLLVYEYISNGNLYEHLHAQVSNQRMATWEVRLRIAIEIAEALSYLHSAASIPIYHRDVKTTNIMLDNKHRAKVSDFGTSRSVTEDHTHLTTRVVSGSAGYLDPEYYQSSQYTERSDVYSYGVVLVELITGEQPVSSTRPTQFRTLATYFNHIIKEDKVVDAIDARIKNECKLEEVMAVAQVARKCLNLKRRKRPDMKQVTMELKKIRCSPEDMLTHVDLSDDEEEKRNLEAFVGIEGTNNVAVTAPVPSQHNVASSSYSSRWSDTEPMCPLRTQNTF
ncbi:hypothetical protein AALP_AAs57564U000100 [Arabis alpina]|uniref:Protein kinase domain-containing protein n=1 Tax=Arabis alpina TaxID=50452 RepID=A0A087G2U7_ARAAL|nr:hypothetical protein AALP_AAs57564U000100 [Arabis alpina]